MTKISDTQKKKIRIDGFGGIDLSGNQGGAELVSNFRFLKDGTLLKRGGTKKLLSLPFAVRAIWSGRENGEYKCYVLAQNRVYSVSLATGEYTEIGAVGTYSGEADFFYCHSALYLAEGSSLYRVTDSSLSVPHGYVPLVGKDWIDAKRGEPYERRNLLNNQGRISYIMTGESPSFLVADQAIGSVNAIFVNGELIPSSRYEITNINDVVHVSELSSGDKVTMFFTYLNGVFDKSELFSCRRAAVFGGIDGMRPFLWDGSVKNLMYCAGRVSRTSLAESQKGVSQSDALYFPVDNAFTVGDGRHPVRDVNRHYDRLLIFTDGDAWMADSEACSAEDFPIMNINSTVGTASKRGADCLDNDPYTVGDGAIYRWTSDTDKLDECNAVRVSRPIEPMLTEGFFSTARVYGDRRRGELYFSSEALGDKTLVYCADAKAWTTFDGIEAEGFFDADTDVGFWKENGLYAFDSSLDSDLGGKEIEAIYVSNPISLGDGSKKKVRAVRAEAYGGYVTVGTISDNGARSQREIDQGEGSKRISAPRSEKTRLTLVSSHKGASQIRGATIITN